MTAPTPPADSASLLVPVHLDAWVVDTQTQQGTAIYYTDFTQLSQFQSPVPDPFNQSDADKPSPAVRLHWALPDALTHARRPAAGGEMSFPLVPNRWLVARFQTPSGGSWQCKLWVVQSDYVGSALSTTAADLTGTVSQVSLVAPGASAAVEAGAEIQVIGPGGTVAAVVTAAAAAAAGATQLSIQSYNFPTTLPAGSTVQLVARSAFLDPHDPSYMTVTGASVPQTTININLASIGKSYAVESWEATGDQGTDRLFLRAVGPGNVSFAAYRPFVRDVFSFTDTELPAEGTGVYNFTYMVVGWYSDPAHGDPLRGVSAYDPNVWATEQEWQGQTPERRFQTLLTRLKWSVNTPQGTTPAPVSTSLYHGLVAEVVWPSHVIGNPGSIDPGTVHVAVANTSTDALAALVKAEARAQANKQSDPERKSAWTAAGDTLARLMQAAMYDLLPDYGKPGGAVLIEQQIEQAWFGAVAGGNTWEVASLAPQNAAQAAAPARLTPAQAAAVDAALAALNAAQLSSDEGLRELQSLQAQLYQLWWKVGRAYAYPSGWDEGPNTTPDWSVLMPFVLSLYPPLFQKVWEQYCAVGQAQSLLPDPTDPAGANAWANANAAWRFPDGKGQNTLTLAGLGLQLKSSAMPRFGHPNDPVFMVAGLRRARRHGEDGRYNKDGTLTCRLPGQTITGVQVAGQPAVNAQTVTQGGVNLQPCGPFTSVPSIPTLVAEAFFVDPGNAAAMAAAVGGGADPQAIRKAITSLLDAEAPNSNAWTGTPPAPFAINDWDQAWAPLFLEWGVQFYPTGPNEQFSLTDWQFDGAHYGWLGTGFDPDNVVGYKGRTILTPQAPLTFKAKIEQYLKNNPGVDSAQLEQLIDTVSKWDVLSQTLSGMSDQLITLLSQQTFPPTPGSGAGVPCPAGGATPPDVAALVGDQYHSMPVVEGTNPDAFFPVRAGFVQFQALQIVDAFGQSYGGPIYPGQGQTSVWINTPQGFQPTLDEALALSCAPTVPPAAAQAALASIPYGSFQLPPRVVQSTRLDIDFLAADASGTWAPASDDPNPVCGWLLPNHLDGAIAVYDHTGVLLGELLALPPGEACDNWRPRPGDPGANPPPRCPADIANAALRSVVESIAAQPAAVFRDILTVIDETLWMVDPLGGRKDQFFSVLVGRPLAVVQTRLKLSLYGEPVFNQMWDRTVANPSADPVQFTQLKDTGGVLDIPFPVRLGSLELRNDGLIGYYLPQDNYATFYAVHYPDDITAGDTYVRQIVRPAPPAGAQPYQGDITLKPNGDAVNVTMLIDPRGAVHAYTGLLPVAAASLPGQLVEEFIKNLLVTFRTGPIIADPGTLRLPQPAEQHGYWTWIQAAAPPSGGQGTTWETDTTVDANDEARMPDTQLQLREGWLQLTDITEPSP